MRFAVAWAASLLVVAGAPLATRAPGDHGALGQTVGPDRQDDVPIDLESLLRTFGQAPGVEARFVEEKHIKLLAVPLKTAGMLYYAPPGMLARRTTSPSPSTLVVTPTQVHYGDGDDWKTIELDGRPEVAALVQGFVTILQGDVATLRRLYDVDFRSAPAGAGSWSLVLMPRAAPLSRLIERITLQGKHLVIREMRVVETEGDEAITRFDAVDPARSFTAEERARLFSPPAR